MTLWLTTLPMAALRSPFGRRELEVVLRAMLEPETEDVRILELALLDDAGISLLHQNMLGCNGPTNILSFPAVAGDNEGSPGSLALSVDTLHREAFLYGQSTQEHMIRLLAHGLAHLLGHDHGPAMDALAASFEKAGLDAARMFQP